MECPFSLHSHSMHTQTHTYSPHVVDPFVDDPEQIGLLDDPEQIGLLEISGQLAGRKHYFHGWLLVTSSEKYTHRFSS